MTESMKIIGMSRRTTVIIYEMYMEEFSKFSDVFISDESTSGLAWSVDNEE